MKAPASRLRARLSKKGPLGRSAGRRSGERRNPRKSRPEEEQPRSLSRARRETWGALPPRSAEGKADPCPAGSRRDRGKEKGEGPEGPSPCKRATPCMSGTAYPPTDCTAVLSAMGSLTAGFGMGPGDPPLHGSAHAGR